MVNVLQRDLLSFSQGTFSHTLFIMTVSEKHKSDINTKASPMRRGLAICAGKAISVIARVLTAPRISFQAPIPKDRQIVYFANHTSNADTVLIWTALGKQRHKTRPVAAADYWLTSTLRRFIGLDVFRVLPIERRPQKRTADPIEQMSQAIGQGDSLIIFPEGTRNDTGAPLLDLKPGIYHLARKHPDITFVPIWIDNLSGVMPRGEIIPVPLICSLTFGSPFSLREGESRHAFMSRARERLLDLAPDRITQENTNND